MHVSTAIVGSIRNTLLASLKARWESPTKATILACFLDPRFKASSSFVQVNATTAICHEPMPSLATMPQPSVNVEREEEFLFPPDVDESPPARPLDEELALYCLEWFTPKKHDPLLWWREHAPKYRYLSVLARKYLCIPATSVPSERLFSAAGAIVAPRRTSLDTDTVCMQLFLHSNARFLGDTVVS